MISKFKLFIISQPGGSPYHTIHPADTSLEGWNFPSLKQYRSNSWSESLDGLQVPDNEYGRNSKYEKVLKIL